VCVCVRACVCVGVCKCWLVGWSSSLLRIFWAYLLGSVWLFILPLFICRLHSLCCLCSQREMLQVINQKKYNLPNCCVCFWPLYL